MALPRLCILSSVHPAFDARIYQKEARTLVKAGFKVILMARSDPTGQVEDGIQLVSLPPPRNRLLRMLSTMRMVNWARRCRAEVYTVHDPELLPAAVLLQLLTRGKVVYDVHENVPAHVRTREWLPALMRPLLPVLYRLVERFCLLFIDGVVVSEDANLRHYAGRQAIVVRNFPLMTYADLRGCRKSPRPTLVYSGNITAMRGLFEMLDLVRRLRPAHPDILLRLVGQVGVAAEGERARAFVADWDLTNNVEWTGRVSLPQVHRHIETADICLALLHSDPNHVESLPTKLFEYMMMGRPVVVTNIPLWQSIVEKADCGYAVDLVAAEELAESVAQLLLDADRRREMGQRGRRAVLENYNWDTEGATLVDFYRALVAGTKAPSTVSACRSQQ